MNSQTPSNSAETRRYFIGGSDARVIMGADEAALLRLWREKRGEAEPQDLSGSLVVQLGVVTEPLNRSWYERNSGRRITDVQRRARHPVNRWMAATLDGMVEGIGAVFEAKFALPWSFSEGEAAEKHMAQLQHNMWVTNAKSAVLSIITGGGKWATEVGGQLGLPAGVRIFIVSSCPPIPRRDISGFASAIPCTRTASSSLRRRRGRADRPMITRSASPSATRRRTLWRSRLTVQRVPVAWLTAAATSGHGFLGRSFRTVGMKVSMPSIRRVR